MYEREPWSFKRWFGGFVDGERYGKDLAIGLRLAVLAGLIYLVAMGFIWTKEKLLPEAKPKAEPIIINSGGAPVDAHKSQKSFTIFDLSKWFGGQKDEANQ